MVFNNDIRTAILFDVYSETKNGQNYPQYNNIIIESTDEIRFSKHIINIFKRNPNDYQQYNEIITNYRLSNKGVIEVISYESGKTLFIINYKLSFTGNDLTLSYKGYSVFLSRNKIEPIKLSNTSSPWGVPIVNIDKNGNVIFITTDPNTMFPSLETTTPSPSQNKFSKITDNALFHQTIISAGVCRTFGLKSDGTVYANGKSDGTGDYRNWHDIVSVSTGAKHMVGLRSDGTVVAFEDNGNGQCNVASWENIVEISAGGVHTVGLKSDGTVVAVGDNQCLQCNVTNWANIIDISAGYFYTIGLKSDGTAFSTGVNDYG